MRMRSTGGSGRTTAWVLVVASVLGSGINRSAIAEEPVPIVNQVKLDVQISGIGTEGCKVEIRPANPACKFEPVVQTFEQTPESGVIRLDSLAIAASSLSADRQCFFAITITEPGGAPQTFKRSVRLLVPKEPGSTPEISQTFYLRNTSVASKDPSTRRPG